LQVPAFIPLSLHAYSGGPGILTRNCKERGGMALSPAQFIAVEMPHRCVHFLTMTASGEPYFGVGFKEGGMLAGDKTRTWPLDG
jgi:hypothetical protein